jgi:hypothetical protein
MGVVVGFKAPGYGNYFCVIVELASVTFVFFPLPALRLKSS